MNARMALLILAALALTVAVYAATGGHFVVFLLPLLFVAPLVARRRR